MQVEQDRPSRPAQRAVTNGNRLSRSPDNRSRPWRQSSPSKPAHQQQAAARAATLPRNYLRANKKRTAAASSPDTRTVRMRKAASERRLAPPPAADRERPKSDVISDPRPTMTKYDLDDELLPVIEPSRHPVQHSPILPRRSPVPPPSRHSLRSPATAEQQQQPPQHSTASSKVSTPLLANHSRPASKGIDGV